MPRSTLLFAVIAIVAVGALVYVLAAKDDRESTDVKQDPPAETPRGDPRPEPPPVEEPGIPSGVEIPDSPPAPEPEPRPTAVPEPPPAPPPVSPPAPKPPPPVLPEGPAIDDLLDNLSSEEAGKRFAAVVELGRAKSAAALEDLMSMAEGEKDIFVRRAICRSLGEIGDDKAVPLLIDLLGDKEVFVVSTAKKALEKISGKSFDTQAEWRKWWGDK